MADNDENFDVHSLRGHYFQNSDELVYWVKWCDIPGVSNDWPAEQDYVNENEMSCPELIQQYWLDFRDRVVMTLPLSITQRRALELYVGRKVKECFRKSQWYLEHMDSDDYYDCPITTHIPVPKFLLHPILRVTEKDGYGRSFTKNAHIFEVMLKEFFSCTGFYSYTVHLFAMKCLHSENDTITPEDVETFMKSNEEFKKRLDESPQEKSRADIVNEAMDYLEKLVKPVNYSQIRPEMTKYYVRELKAMQRCKTRQTTQTLAGLPNSLADNSNPSEMHMEVSVKEEEPEEDNAEGAQSLEEAIAKYKKAVEQEHQDTFKMHRSAYELIRATVKNMHYWNTDEDCLIDDIYKIEQFPFSKCSLQDLYTGMMFGMFKTACAYSSTASLKGFEIVDILLIVKDKSSNSILCLTVHRNRNYELEGVYIPFNEALSTDAELVKRCFYRQRALAEKTG